MLGRCSRLGIIEPHSGSDHPSIHLEPSDDLFMVFGLGQYPNLGVTDAFVCISHGDIQHTVRASRELGSDRMDTSVGPFKFEVIEGLKKLRITCDENEWGIGFDVTWNGSQPPLEEPKSIKKSFNRTTMENARFAQTGTYSGTVEVAGKSYDVRPDKWKGARDRSWGVRSVRSPRVARSCRVVRSPCLPVL